MFENKFSSDLIRFLFDYLEKNEINNLLHTCKYFKSYVFGNDPPDAANLPVLAVEPYPPP